MDSVYPGGDLPGSSGDDSLNGTLTVFCGGSSGEELPSGGIHPYKLRDCRRKRKEFEEEMKKLTLGIGLIVGSLGLGYDAHASTISQGVIDFNWVGGQETIGMTSTGTGTLMIDNPSGENTLGDLTGITLTQTDVFTGQFGNPDGSAREVDYTYNLEDVIGFHALIENGNVMEFLFQTSQVNAEDYNSEVHIAGDSGYLGGVAAHIEVDPSIQAAPEPQTLGLLGGAFLLLGLGTRLFRK